MTLRQHFANAIVDLSRNKLRTGLSMLWIIIWVFSVIVLLSVWNWATEEIVWKINSIWTNLLTVSPGSSIFDVRGWSSKWSMAKLDDKVVSFLETNISNLGTISPVTQWSKQINYNDINTIGSIIWVDPGYFTVRDLDVINGRGITKSDVSSMKKVWVLWNKIAKDLFKDEDPIWKNIKLENIIINIVWVLDEDMMTDSALLVPISTAQIRILWNKNYSSFFISVAETNKVSKVKSEVENALLTYYWIDDPDDANFTVASQEDLVEIVDQIMWIMSTFLACIAAISLLVWWIWVMNIMLVSVTERTKEIWIRKAIWAKRSDIISQFLAESVLMTIIWWIIWILLSAWVVRIVNHVQNTLHAVISVNSVLIAVFSSISIGLIFWILPAKNAAKLKPIDALRFE